MNYDTDYASDDISALIGLIITTSNGITIHMKLGAIIVNLCLS